MIQIKGVMFEVHAFVEAYIRELEAKVSELSGKIQELSNKIEAKVTNVVSEVDMSVAAAKSNIAKDKNAFVDWVKKEYGAVVNDEEKVESFIKNLIKKL